MRKQYDNDFKVMGFSGNSAGTTLSSIMAQKYKNCKSYVGMEGMYNVLDKKDSLSFFPSDRGKAIYGLTDTAQQRKASAYYHLRKDPKPATALLFHGKDDYLCHYTQSLKYADQIKKYGGKAKVVLYEGINHTCASEAYPETFKNSVLEMAKHYEKAFKMEEVDLVAIEEKLDDRLSGQYPYEKINSNTLIGTWKSNQRKGTYVFNKKGVSKYIKHNGKEVNVSYKNEGSFFTVMVEGDPSARTFYLRKNERVIYERITAEAKNKSRNFNYIKQE